MTASQQARDALAAGDLDAAQAKLVEAIRSAPGDPALRSFLFQLSCVRGDWSRATKQLDVLTQLDAEAVGMASDYRAAIAAEQTRAAVLAGRMPPLVFGEGHAWASDLAEALRRDAAGDAQAAAEFRAKALEAAPADSGSINGTPFAWCADADTRFGPVIEAVMNGAYRWIPMAELVSLEVEPPSDLRDVVWTIGIASLVGGAQWPIMIPTRYPGAVESGDPATLLARRTDWREIGEGQSAGSGQRLLATDVDDYPLLELRALRFDRPEETAEPSGAAG